MTAFTFTETLSLVITSCAGTSIVTVRRPTLTARSRMGISRMSPGPRSPTSRPSRNTTSRSYSRTTLMEFRRITSSAKPTKIRNGTSKVPSDPISSLPGRGPDPQRESLDAGHDDLGAHLDRGGSFRVPHLAVQSHAAARRESLHDLRPAPEQRRLARGARPAPAAHREADHDQEERHGDRGRGQHQRRRDVDGLVVEQDQPAERERERAAHPQPALAAHPH